MAVTSPAEAIAPTDGSDVRTATGLMRSGTGAAWVVVQEDGTLVRAAPDGVVETLIAADRGASPSDDPSGTGASGVERSVMVTALTARVGDETYSPFPELHLGELDVTSPSDRRHKFVLVNPTEEPVRIEAAGTTCGCLAVDARPEIIEPHSAAVIPLRIEFNLLEAKGELDQTVTVTLGGGSSVRVRVRASVFGRVGVIPEVLNLGVLDGTPWSGRVAVVSPTHREITVEPVELPDGVALVASELAPGGAIELTFSGTADAFSRRGGRQFRSGLLRVTGGGRFEQFVPVNFAASRRAWLVVEPASYYAGPVAPGAKFYFDAGTPDGRELRAAVLPGGRVEFISRPKPNVLRVWVRAPAEPGPFAFDALLNDGQRTVRVPVAGTVRPEIRSDS